MPKVSVIIPTYNRAESLRLAIASVLNQTYQDFEIIVVDDASKDNTQEVVPSLKDNRINYIRHDTNKQISASRNTGVVNSAGKYIAFLDDDDEWLPQKLQLQVNLLEGSPLEIGVVYTGFYKIDKKSGKILGQIVPRKRGNIFNDILFTNLIGTSTVLLRKECFQNVGLFDEAINFAEDYDMWLRISKEFQFEYIIKPLVKYFVHPMALSMNYDIKISGLEILHNKYDWLYTLNKRRYSHSYLHLGVLHCYNGNTKKGRKAFLKAIKLYPFEIRHYYNLCLSLLGAGSFKKLRGLREKLFASLP